MAEFYDNTEFVSQLCDNEQQNHLSKSMILIGKTVPFKSSARVKKKHLRRLAIYQVCI